MHHLVRRSQKPTRTVWGTATWIAALIAAGACGNRGPTDVASEVQRAVTGTITISGRVAFAGYPTLGDPVIPGVTVTLSGSRSAVQTTVVCPFYIDTGMFSGVKSRFSWLLPILKEDDVATRVVAAIQHNKRRLLMPPAVYLVPPMRVLPVRGSRLGEVDRAE